MMKCMKCGREAHNSTTTEMIAMNCGLLVIRLIVARFSIPEMMKHIAQEVTIIDYEKSA